MLVFCHCLPVFQSDYFPIWGTCQGLQQMTVLTNNKNLLTLTETKAVALPLTFTPELQPECQAEMFLQGSDHQHKAGMVHSAASVRASFYTAHFFVSEGELF
uniref:Uncharacterized protein n=1 Tax=Hucho hucho TaxID=62062 RepID=A0A4W5RHJ3_9TELE